GREFDLGDPVSMAGYRSGSRPRDARSSIKELSIGHSGPLRILSIFKTLTVACWMRRLHHAPVLCELIRSEDAGDLLHTRIECRAHMWLRGVPRGINLALVPRENLGNCRLLR